MAWKRLRDKCFNGFARLPGRMRSIARGRVEVPGRGGEGIVAVAATGTDCRAPTAFKGMDQAKMREAGAGRPTRRQAQLSWQAKAGPSVGTLRGPGRAIGKGAGAESPLTNEERLSGQGPP